ncbi:gas vesicle protein K [Candidatus Chlorohelix sp.]|uniref:gas vesicle protein K n=1 Tax=Candidatus Chlorohelix sp. TaxID=3139201 RepID=UPI0030416E2F
MNNELLIESLAEELQQTISDHLKNDKIARIDASPSDVEQGLAKLVLTLIELLRQLLERQAVRRVEGGSLTDAEIERMGDTFIRLEARMKELKEIFGLQDEELNLNLGPLGNLL